MLVWKLVEILMCNRMEDVGKGLVVLWIQREIGDGSCEGGWGMAVICLLSDS